MNKQVTEGFVLHRIPYRESSLLVDVFCAVNGMIRGVAKGVRGTKSDRKSLLQPFQCLEITLSGRNELKNIGRVESTSVRYQLANQPLFCAMYLNELLCRALPNDLPCEGIYALYQETLEALAELPQVPPRSDIEALLRNFELELLLDLGFLPDLAYCADNTTAIGADGYYALQAEAGFTPLDSNQPDGFHGKDILAIAARDWHQSSLLTAKRFMRTALVPLIGTKPLRSRELFGGVK
ncbi:DNA repair protein RecO [Alteromonas sp. ASW11-36]|uniref:DNA repair protein RecO n=1 Tax=Alteromonas arenosi TaxID=3055817 RepID=A0ABT7T052_9ALTE|nr:DNA repair protein RecO [Alteromonas sp. ASW11-36]MDM7861817.1 DNA repair protein RecO [Alteromonas sp. ASW11-36]